MAVNGLGAGQQVPLSNTFQPGENSARTQENRKPQEEERTQSTQRTSSAEKSDSSSARSRQVFPSNSNNDDFELADKKRGSVVDITV